MIGRSATTAYQEQQLVIDYWPSKWILAGDDWQHSHDSGSVMRVQPDGALQPDFSLYWADTTQKVMILETCRFIGSLLPGLAACWYSHVYPENDTPVEYSKIPHAVGF